MSDTIAAIASGNIVSAIGILRLSGDDAINIVSSLFRPTYGGMLSEAADRCLVLGDLLGSRGQVLDNCLATISRAPKSYTGENTAELQCHGSPTVLRLALEALFSKGARQALPGEFTKRAFLNGRMDLTQAEAVIDLIDATTAAAAENAAGQLGGAILHRTDDIYSSLLDIISHYHAVLDYPDEDIADFQLKDYEKTLNSAVDELSALLKTFERGRVMKSGVPATIVGKPNAGKSSLLNALLGYERAIVTSIPGTTRDTIEECVSLGGVLLRLTDTAGIRGTSDPIEKIGVDRAISSAGSAELVLAVFDGSCPLCDEDFEAISAAKSAKCSVAVVNKSDLPQLIDVSLLRSSFNSVCAVSALDKTGLDALGAAVAALFPLPAVPAGEILTNSRHAEAVSRALISMNSAIDAMKLGETPDIVLTEAENALSAMGELTGKNLRSDITERIFSRFCVGK
ncbi:MAG: tRNA uridine-5-carboxymethylaminomethyl(34) synthesis GTPase MnmE [Oscillospiraceae bacterium]